MVHSYTNITVCCFGHGEKLMVSGLASVKQVSSTSLGELLKMVATLHVLSGKIRSVCAIMLN